jgi:hypothetical protein
MSRKQTPSGFTIVELSIAMGFVSMLLLAVAMLTIYISGVYSKGITLKQVNQAGVSIADDVRRTVGASVPFVVDPSSPATRYVINGDEGGRLCAGGQSYIWRFANASGNVNTYSTAGEGEPSLVKVADPSGGFCRVPYPRVPRDRANELLNAADRNLALYEFTVSSPSNVSLSTSQALYTINFKIGTNSDDLIDPASGECKPPSESQGGDEYCAVNNFSIVVRAGSEAGGGS